MQKKNMKQKVGIAVFLLQKSRKLSNIKQNEYDLAKYIINCEKQSILPCPLIGSTSIGLTKGEYYLYFVYAYNKLLSQRDTIDDNIFRGYFISNKVKLIVK